MVNAKWCFWLAAGLSLLAVSAPAQEENGQAALPRSFRELRLGMGLDDLKSVLQQDELFRFRGDRDVSFLPFREQSLVETTGATYIRRAFFQLREGELFIMAFSLDSGMVDHYSVYTSFVKKYGEPASLSPAEAVWENDDTRIAIERPLTVKYIDKKVFNDIIAESKAAESSELKQREDFLNDF
ncbi:MAG: hypothetical protein LBG76_07855 [Treponema sp.]|jgi:hypothetical protein|nr:hypothetical protein [Treponema sp.]